MSDQQFNGTGGRGRRGKRFLSPSEKYEIWLSLVRGEYTIVQAAERMRDITRQVRSATQEQTTGSRLIANAVESVTAQASQVARSTAKQSLGTQQISEAIDRIQKITKETVDVSIEMDMAVKALKQKADALQSELEGFKF